MNFCGENVADRVLKGCNVHWTRSYQRVADKVNNNVHRSNRVLAKEAFCAVAKQVMVAKTKEDVLKLFDVLQDKAEISTVQHLLSLPDEHLTVVTHNCDWSSACKDLGTVVDKTQALANAIKTFFSYVLKSLGSSTKKHKQGGTCKWAG